MLTETPVQHLILCTLQYHWGCSREYALPACTEEWAEKAVWERAYWGDCDIWAEYGYENGHWESIAPYAWPVKRFEVMAMIKPNDDGESNEHAWEVMRLVLEAPDAKSVEGLVEGYIFLVTRCLSEILDCQEVK